MYVVGVRDVQAVRGAEAGRARSVALGRVGRSGVRVNVTELRALAERLEVEHGVLRRIAHDVPDVAPLSIVRGVWLACNSVGVALEGVRDLIDQS